MNDEQLMMDVVINGVTERRAATWHDIREIDQGRIDACMRVPRPVLRHGELDVQTISGETFIYRTHN